MSQRLSTVLLALFTGVVTGIFAYIFYASPLRERVEDRLFDIRTRIAPNLVPAGQVAILGIGEPTLAAYGDERGELPIPMMERIARAALDTGAAHVALLLPPQVFPYEDPAMAKIVELAHQNPRLVIGAFGISGFYTRVSEIPEAFASIPDQVAAADVTRFFRQGVVRTMRVMNFQGVEYLPGKLTALIAPERLEEVRRLRKEDHAEIRLNYFNPKDVLTIEAEAFLREPANAPLEGKTVLVGYTVYRPYDHKHREATFINSPWQADGVDLQQGIPVVTLQAIALLNLVQGEWLRELPFSVNLLQILLASVLGAIIWTQTIGFASLLFIGSWSLILLVHAGLFALVNVYVPLADALLFSSLATVGGALWRLRLEGHRRAAEEARAASERELAQIQGKFLNRFAFELAAINDRIKACLLRQRQLETNGGTMAQAYTKALGGCEELDEYLRGMQQFASLRGARLRRPHLVKVPLKPLIEKVVQQFDSRRVEAELEIKIDCPEDACALGDPTLLAHVLFNLVSNAVKYSPRGGLVLITVGSEGGKKRRVRISVKDQGPGISSEYQERIFEKFYRVKDDLVYKLKGHGLGLYLSRYFADQMQGQLTVASDVGKGAEFTLMLAREG